MKHNFSSSKPLLVVYVCLSLLVISTCAYLLFRVSVEVGQIKPSTDASLYPSEQWTKYDKVYSPIAFSHPESWGEVNINMWWADVHTKGTRYEYYFYGESENNRRPYDIGWRQRLPIALRVETNDSIYRGSREETMISATNVDLSKTDWEIKQVIALPGTEDLRIERVAVAGVNGLYVEERGRFTRDSFYQRSYYLFPKFNKARNLNLTIAMPSDMKDVLGRFVQTLIFKSGFDGVFSRLDSYAFDRPAVDTSGWQTVTNTELRIEYSIPADWTVRACLNRYSYNQYPVGCSLGRDGVILGSQRLMRERGKDLSFSFGYDRDVLQIDRIAMKAMEDAEKVIAEDLIALPLISTYQLSIHPHVGVLKVRKTGEADIVSYEYQFNHNDHSVVLSGTEGSMSGFPPHGTFRAILESIRVVDAGL